MISSTARSVVTSSSSSARASASPNFSRASKCGATSTTFRTPGATTSMLRWRSSKSGAPCARKSDEGYRRENLQLPQAQLDRSRQGAHRAARERRRDVHASAGGDGDGARAQRHDTAAEPRSHAPQRHHDFAAQPGPLAMTLRYWRTWWGLKCWLRWCGGCIDYDDK